MGDSRYRYYNLNPNGEHILDCVCRAISGATGIPYEYVDKLLDYNAKHHGCDKLCVCCYHNILEELFGYTRKVCTQGETVEDIAKMYPNNITIIRIEGHLTFSDKGLIPDIWDCSQEKADCYWVIK